MIEDLKSKVVVLDMVSPFVVIGTLDAVDHRYVALTDVDVHDLRDSSTNREVYIHEVRTHGVAPNRSRTLVEREQIVSISLLSDVNI